MLGFLIGVLPGAGATIAAFMAYGAERNIAGKQRQEQFGKGSLRGLAARKRPTTPPPPAPSCPC